MAEAPKLEPCEACDGEGVHVCGNARTICEACGGSGEIEVEEEEEESEDDDDLMCSACSGSGEGPADGTRCRTCKGRGTIRGTTHERDWDDFDPPYDPPEYDRYMD